MLFIHVIESSESLVTQFTVVVEITAFKVFQKVSQCARKKHTKGDMWYVYTRHTSRIQYTCTYVHIQYNIILSYSSISYIQYIPFCSPRDSSSPKLSRCVSDYWMTMISFTLHKTVASQITVQSTKFNGHHSSSKSLCCQLLS